MKYNMSFFDGIMRIIGAVIFAGIMGALNSPIGVLALVPFVTGLSGWCPIYHVLGISTCEDAGEDHEISHAPVPSREKNSHNQAA